MHLTDPDATRQDLYDAVVTHLWKQRRRAIQGQYCRYRTEHGLKCAVGCLIPDYLYEQSFDDVGSTLEDLLNRLCGSYANLPLLTALQAAHDSSINWDPSGPTVALVDHLRGVAKDFALSTSVLDHLAAPDPGDLTGVQFIAP